MIQDSGPFSKLKLIGTKALKQFLCIHLCIHSLHIGIGVCLDQIAITLLCAIICHVFQHTDIFSWNTKMPVKMFCKIDDVMSSSQKLHNNKI